MGDKDTKSHETSPSRREKTRGEKMSRNYRQIQEDTGGGGGGYSIQSKETTKWRRRRTEGRKTEQN